MLWDMPTCLCVLGSLPCNVIMSIFLNGYLQGGGYASFVVFDYIPEKKHILSLQVVSP